MKKISKILNLFLIIFFILIFLNILSSKSQKAFDIIGYRTYLILTGSMEPTVSAGDLVVVKNIKKSTIKEKDIVTFEENNEVITHRIIKQTPDGYVTKGDNNDVEDKLKLQEDNIIGKVICVIPKAGQVFKILSNQYIIALGLIILGLIYIFI